MAEIIRLEENGVTKYIETHLSAIQGMQYTDIPITYATGFKPYPGTDGLQVRTLGGILTSISGSFTNESDIEPSAEVQVASIPSAYAPKSSFQVLAQGSGSNIFMFSIFSNGRINMSRYRNGGGSVVCTKGSWLTPSVLFPIK